jgi:hypothetical protein
MTSRTWRLLAPWLALLFLAAGCSDSTAPEPRVADGTAAGEIDPGAGTYVLRALDVPMPDGSSLRIELVGRDLVLDDDGEHVDLTVAVRNAGDRPLPAPVRVWLHDFKPGPVHVDNADTTLPAWEPGDDFAVVTPVFGFSYDAEFGDNGELAPGEASAGRLWRFRTVAQEPFSFATRLEVGRQPHGPLLAGFCFYDENRNGQPDRGEHPLLPGVVFIVAPDGTHHEYRVGLDGRYAHELTAAGLYTLEWRPGPEVFVDLEFTTPNPLRVLITTDGDGAPRSYLDAHFGAHARGAFPPPIRFTNAPLDSLHFAPWTLLDVTIVANRVLAPRVAFSGCEPGHPFSLWTNGSFMESEPVQVDMVLVHEVDEDCEVAFEGGYMFDLEPLIASYREAYGHGVLMMNLIDFAGERHQIRLEIPR